MSQLYRMQDARKITVTINPFAKGFSETELKDAHYRLTCDPKQQLLILETASFDEMEGEYGGEELTCDGCMSDCGGCSQNRGMVMEAVRVRAYSRTAQTMAALQRSLNRYMADKGLTVGEATIGKPRKSGLFATVTVQLPVSDGQIITIIFHSPDGNKLQITSADEILAFRWLLNKRDITVAVSPEGEADVSLEEVGKRVAMLVEKNAKAFATKSKEIADQKQQLADVSSQVESAQQETAELQAEFAELEQQGGDIDGKIEQTTAQLNKVREFNAGLEAKITELQAVNTGNDGKGAGTRPADWDTKPPYDDEYTGPRFKYGLQYRPMSIGTQPKGAILMSYKQDDRPETSKGKAKFGTLEYPFPLTEDEIRNFELLDLTGKAEAEEDAAFAVIQQSFAAEMTGRGFEKVEYEALGSVEFEKSLPQGKLSAFIDKEKLAAEFLPAYGNDGAQREYKVFGPVKSLPMLSDRAMPKALEWIDRKLSELKGRGDDDTRYNAAVQSFESTLEGMGFTKSYDGTYRIGLVGSRNGKPFREELSANQFYDEEKKRVVVNAGNETFTAQSKATAGNAFDKGIKALQAQMDGKETVEQWAAKYKGTVDKFHVGDKYRMGRQAFVSKSFELGDYMDGYEVSNVDSAENGGSMLPAIEFRSENSIMNVRYDLLEGYLLSKEILPVSDNSDAGGTGGGSTDTNPAVEILNDILAGKYADSGSIDNALDQAAGQLEEAGLIEQYDELLNEAADYLTTVLRREAA